MSSEEASKAATSSADEDADLAVLLESALLDFDKPPPTPPPKIVELDAEAASTAEPKMDAKWTEEFIKQAAASFDQNMQAFLAQSAPQGGGEGPSVDEIGENFQKMAEAAAKALGDDNTSQDFSAAISQTLRNLSEGADNLQNPLSEADLAGMFGGLGMGEGGAEGGDFLPFMQNMMQSLLSKEILYPALKDIVDKYPAWMVANAGALPPDDFERFSKQQRLMTSVCAELEHESSEDSTETRNARFNKILDLMQQMQDCGQPPPDLVGDLSSVMSFDDQGVPRLPGMPPGGDPANCSLM